MTAIQYGELVIRSQVEKEEKEENTNSNNWE